MLQTWSSFAALGLEERLGTRGGFNRVRKRKQKRVVGSSSVDYLKVSKRWLNE